MREILWQLIRDIRENNYSRWLILFMKVSNDEDNFGHEAINEEVVNSWIVDKMIKKRPRIFY